MEIVAWIAIVYLVIYLAFNISIYFAGLIEGSKYWSIKATSMIAKNDIWYLIPTIGINIYPSCEIIFYWLNYQWYLCYEIDKNES